ncbi:hypothetical protein O1611_g1115 [Lasiodiplodia mahajangana]|uniref:Uncharacterized protein n=1 Tax=Lasiodiplodia mahajangana TaxID=1108764 RepID=A0ACC2JZ37_9PEZI|nr:hypothetical protein O1611_g1115 [Lasiodiplodia mahajangana]
MIGQDVRENCEKTWDNALERCGAILGEDDFAEISSYKSPEQLLAAMEALQRQHSGSVLLRLIRRTLPAITHLRTFTTTLLLALGPSQISIVCIWGVMSLLIDLASHSEKAMSEIATMLEELGQNFALFKIYSNILQLGPELYELLFDTLVELIMFSAGTIKHFRRNGASLTGTSWSSIKEKYATMSSNLTNRMRYMKERVEAENIAGSNSNQTRLGSISTVKQWQPVDEIAKLPCHILPFPRNLGFFGREEILSKIERNLKPATSTIVSLGIWGTGGIGKSQIALEYANRCLETGLPVIIWIPSETKEEVTAAFVNASHALGLPGASETNLPDQNRRMVLEWLQKTTCQWLLIFDNVENEEVVQQNWPISGHGSVLLTCRSEMMAASYTASVLEIPTFNDDEGSRLILQILAREITDEERRSSLELTRKLGGLALALDLMAKQIRSRKTTITHFLPYYEGSHQSLHRAPRRGIKNHYYSKDLETVWATSFERLESRAGLLMSMLCFFAPEAIPFDILNECTKPLGPFEFVKDIGEFDEIKLDLLDLALLSVNPTTSLGSLHRLIQTAYLDRMTADEKVRSLKGAMSVLRSSFPEQGNGRHLRPHFKTCERLIQHVQVCAQRYNELYEAGYAQSLDDVTLLFSDAAWYLHEIGAHASSNQLLKTAMLSCKDKLSLAYSNLCTTAGTNDDQRGHGPNAVHNFTEALDIRRALLPRGHEEITNSLSNASLGWVGIHRPDQALELLTEAIDIDMEKPWAEQLDANTEFRFRNRARVYNVLGRYDEAEKSVEEASKYTRAKNKPGSYYEAENFHILAHVAFNRGDFEKSLKLEDHALRIFLQVQPTHHYVSTAYYRKGLVKMRQGLYDEALNSFHLALQICAINEEQKGDKGESARVLRNMSEVMRRQGLGVKSQELLTAAQAIYNDCHATGLYTGPRNGLISSDDGWDNLIAFLYR